MIRRIIKVFSSVMVGLLAIAILAVAGGHFYLKTGHGQNMIKSAVNGAIPGHIEWESLDLSILDGRIGIHKAVLSDPENTIVADAELLFLDIGIVELLRGTLDIVARLDTPRVMLSVDPDGTLNLIRAFASPSPDVPPAPQEAQEDGEWAMPIGILLRSVTLSNGFFSFEDHASPGTETPGRISINDIHLDIDNVNPAVISGRIDFSIGNSLIDLPGVYLPLEHFLVETVMDKGSIHPLALDLQLAGESPASLNLSGAVNLGGAFPGGLMAAPADLDAITYDLLLDAGNIDFDRLFWIAPYVSGVVDAFVEINGSGISPESLSARIDAKISGRQISAGSILSPIDPDITITGRIKDGKAFADPVALSVRDTLLRVTGEYDIMGNAVDAAVTLETPDMAQFLAPLDVAVSSGEARLSGTVSGPVMQPEINVAVQSRALAYDSLRFGDVALDAALDTTGRVIIDRLFADNRGSLVEITGHLDLFDGGFSGFRSDMPADLEAILTTVAVPDFYPEFGLEGKISGTLNLSNKITAPELTLSLDAGGLTLDERSIGDLKASATLSDGTAAIEHLQIKNRQSIAALSGSVDIFHPGSLSLLDMPRIDLAVRESALFLEDFIDDVAGRLAFEGHAKGVLSDITADLMVAGENLEAAGTRIGGLEASVGFSRGRLTLAPLEVFSNGSRVTITGGADLFEPGTLDMHDDPVISLAIIGDEIHIDDFLPGMSGRLSLNGKVNGSAGDPRGTIELEGHAIDLGVQQIHSLKLTSIFRDRSVFLENAQADLAPGETIRAEGKVSLDNHYAFEMDSDDINLNRIGVLADAGITGKMRMTAAGEGRLDNPELGGRLSAFDLVIEENALPPIDIAFELGDRIADIRAISNFTAQAAYDLDSGHFDFNGAFEDTALDPFLRMAGLTALSGRLTGNVSAGGSMSGLSQVSADLDLEHLVIVQERTGETPLEVVRMENFSARLENSAFSIPKNEIWLLAANPVVVSGSGRLDGDYEFLAEGTIPLAAAAALVPDLEDPEGTIDFSGSFSQTGGRPDIDAEIVFHELGLTVPVLMQKLGQINGRIHITETSVTIEDVTGRMDGGRFHAEGEIGMEEGFSPGMARLSVNTHALPIRVPGTLEITVNSELLFSGTPDDTRLSGQIIFLDGLYYRDARISLIEEVTRRRRAAPTRTETDRADYPYLKNLALDIDTSFRKPLMVDNNLALMTLRPELRINGTLDQPRVTGRAEVAQGTVSFQNIEFDIARGIIDFVDPYRIQPDIDIRAISNVRKWVILLEISGTPDELEFKLSSNPHEEHADILSLLLLGKTTRELAEGTGPAGPSPEEMLVNLLTDRLEEDIRAGTGLDIFELEYTPGSADAETDPALRVKIGKELSRRLTVTYGVERKGSETFHQQAAIYRLLEFMSMSAFQDTGGTYGGEMQFRLEFR